METIISHPKTTAAAATATATSPSPSCTSSPSHEFSFTISFHPSPLPVPKSVLSSNSSTTTAIDLSPADDIFFHGHLLPLQLLSHPPPPPPPTTIPQFSTSQPPIDHQKPNPNNTHLPPPPPIDTNKEKSTSKTISNPFYSLFSGRGKTRKQVEEEDKKKRSFDVGRLLKKYALLLEALFSRGGSKAAKRDLRRRPCSFSVNSNWKGREEWIEKRRKRWGQLSAPASMRTSPTNSGLLVATGPNAGCGGSSEESTMEELQNAIQAAIAHCKNSIALKEEKISV